MFSIPNVKSPRPDGYNSGFYKSSWSIIGPLQKCLQITGFQEGSLPFGYLGVPITARRLGTLEYRELVDKIMLRVKGWATRIISFIGRAVLINSVLFGMFNYWASIFILPQEVVDKITKICRNYLWGANPDTKKIPYISCQVTCTPKKVGGLGIKNLTLWNQASIAKLVWDIANKKDSLWARWVHGRYLKNKNWWGYIPAQDNSWYWKKLCAMKNKFKVSDAEKIHKDWEGVKHYTVKAGYIWLLDKHERKD
ncbi:hypothetical protein Cgig2_018694 [Carnegiea gigantea]|uniref:Uncharacterized protein n=1 Tax=Carnegiea gigantea TaxID=171969 RepID=A0A9Q1JH26_9CARY|nr:hypothetical protein Cgig2_018694 [Carnegiea gigantea]